MSLKFGLVLLLLNVIGGGHFTSKSELDRIPVQDGGRIKPLQTFARESLKLVYGKTSFQKKSATEIVMTWMLVPEHWGEIPIVEVRHAGLRKALNLEGSEVHRRPVELMSNSRLNVLIQDLRVQQKAKIKLNPYYQAIQTLENKLMLFNAIQVGRALRVAPQPDQETWWSVAELKGDVQIKFGAVTQAFASGLTSKKEGGASEVQKKHLKGLVDEFMVSAQSIAPQRYANLRKVRVELMYNRWQPFMWSWVLYLLAAIFMVIAWVRRGVWMYRLSWGVTLIAFAVHILGMVQRVYLMGRPPVSNMYETIIWVPWGAVLFAMVLEKLRRQKVILLGAQLVAVFCLILSDLSPVVLDGSLQPLEPVLRDNFWLMVHVLVITLSYGAFFLAFVLGDITLFQFISGEQKNKVSIKEGVLSQYRAIQIGVVLLALGTITGGIWADYSWGRFWGWDPKETWALIALLGYLAILHGRLVGMFKDFAFTVGSIVAFSLVIMAWYGVNFVLGVGLHSYGFGAGGTEYVAAFVGVHFLYVTYAVTVRQARLKEGVKK